MWMVERDWEEDGRQTMGVIHVDSIIRGAHLIPVYGEEFVPRHINFSNSLDYYAAYYVNNHLVHLWAQNSLLNFLKSCIHKCYYWCG